MNDNSKLITFLSILLILFCSAIVILQTNPLDHLPGRDGGYFLYAGNQILESKIPYQDFWDSKPPLIFYVNALGLFIGKGTQWGIFLLEYIAISGSAISCFFAVRKKFGVIIGNISIGISLLILSRFLDEGNYTEEFSLLFNSIAIFLFLNYFKSTRKKWILFAIGALTAISFLFRPNNIGIEIAIFLALSIESLVNKNFKQFFIQIINGFLGFIVIIGMVSILFASKGLFFEMFEASILYNFFYAGKSGFSLNSILSFASHTPSFAYILLIGLIVFFYDLNSNRKTNKSFVVQLFIIMGILIDLILSTLSGRGYDHYFIVFFPYISLTIGYLIFRASSGLFPQIKPIYEKKYIFSTFIIALIILISVLNKEVSNYFSIAQRLFFEREKGVELMPDIALYLNEHTENNDEVLIWGSQLGFHFFSDTAAPSRFGWYPMYVESPFSVNMYNEFYDDFVESRPTFIIDTYNHSPDTYISLNKEMQSWQLNKPSNSYYLPENIYLILEFIDNNYELINKIDDYEIFKLIE